MNRPGIEMRQVTLEMSEGIGSIDFVMFLQTNDLFGFVRSQTM